MKKKLKAAKKKKNRSLRFLKLNMDQLRKIISLIKKTGDRVVVLDEKSESGYVVMTISEYEKLILGQSGVQGLTEDELLAKINRDIAIWKDFQEKSQLPIDQYDFAQDLGNFGEIYPKNEDFFEENNQKNKENDEDQYYFEPIEQAE